MTEGHVGLTQFYATVSFLDPELGADIHEDVLLVGVGAMAADRGEVLDAVHRLRQTTKRYQVLQRDILEPALDALGYPKAVRVEFPLSNEREGGSTL